MDRLRGEEPDGGSAGTAGPTSDPAAWVDLHGDALFRFAMLRVRDRERAEELVQETFLAALRGRAGFEGTSSERTWLIAILRRKIVDHVRRKAVQGTSLDMHDRAGTPEAWFDGKGKWKEPVPEWPSDPASLVTNSEFRRALDECLSKLPPALLEAFALREAEQMESAEVCKVLGITPTNLWTQLHRARMSLRKCLESNWFLGGG
jgi:RNA polymerase sigma-70 factor (ECF subfamily)